ncbi:MAG: hypothetical protein ACJ746_06825 [Bryobacteraceae bacterium]
MTIIPMRAGRLLHTGAVALLFTLTTLAYAADQHTQTATVLATCCGELGQAR